MVSPYRVTVDDAAQFTDDEIAAENALFNTIEAVVWPEDPVTPLPDAVAAHRGVPDRVRRTSVRAWADTALAGYVNLQVDPEHDDDPEVLRCMVLVGPEHRRSGIGSHLLAEVLGIARSDGRTRLIGRSWDAISAGEHFAAAMGAMAVSRTHTNHLRLTGVDRAFLEQWVADAPNRAPGYELLAWDGPIPEEHLDAFVDLMLVMNDAPRDDADLNDFTLTPERWRDAEQQGREQGHERWTLVARTTDGTLVGLHDITWVPTIPGVAFIGSTGVRPEHRGFALGKWLKAAMTVRVLDERPDATEIRTDNADSNAAMLGINHQMGYRPMLGSVTWQAGVEETAGVLAERGYSTRKW